jgi:hypothetical protein
MAAKIDRLNADVQELQRRAGIGHYFWKATGTPLLAMALGASSALILAMIALSLFLFWNWL